MKKIVILGGAFFSLGNVNPAAEANVKKHPLNLFFNLLLMKIIYESAASMCRYIMTRKQLMWCSRVELISLLLG